jgi:hypothetical protein
VDWLILGGGIEDVLWLRASEKYFVFGTALPAGNTIDVIEYPQFKMMI